VYTIAACAFAPAKAAVNMTAITPSRKQAMNFLHKKKINKTKARLLNPKPSHRQTSGAERGKMDMKSKYLVEIDLDG